MIEARARSGVRTGVKRERTQVAEGVLNERQLGGALAGEVIEVAAGDAGGGFEVGEVVLEAKVVVVGAP